VPSLASEKERDADGEGRQAPDGGAMRSGKEVGTRANGEQGRGVTHGWEW
jgi:hypothetical protein